MSLDSLPDELIGLICSFCDVLEIKSLRLTCRTLQKVANEHLFSEIVMFMNRESLDACKGIAAHPIFSKTTQTLWIQGDRPKEMSYEDWNTERCQDIHRSQFREACDIIHDGSESIGLTEEKRLAKINTEYEDVKAKYEKENPPLSEEQLGYHFAQACRLASDAEEMLHDGSLRSSLEEVFAQCPRIELVDVTMWHAIRVCTARYNKAFQRGLVRPIGDSDEHSSGVGVMMQLVLAASQAGFSPRLLRLGTVSHYIFMNEDVEDELHDFLESVEDLEWHFLIPILNEDCDVDHEELEDIVSDFNDCNQMVELLQAATCLKRLHLELPGDPEAQSAVRLPHVIGNTTWKQLAHIHLLRFDATQNELTTFLLRHSETLEVVYLGDVFLEEGEWSDCFDTLAGKLPSVREFELRGGFEAMQDGGTMFYWFGHLDGERGNKYSKKVSNYLIAGGEECPPKPEVQESADDEWSEKDDDESLPENASGDGSGDDHDTIGQ